MIQEFKDGVALELGYPNWTEYYNWVCRESQNQIVASRQIESAMMKVIDKVIDSVSELPRERFDSGGLSAQDIKDIIYTGA